MKLTFKNRDMFVKFSFLHFIIYLLMILGINEEVESIDTTEIISFDFDRIPEIFNNFMDFRILTKSGRILL